MTDKEMAVAIARRVLRFQAREIAADTYLSRLRLNGISLPWQAEIERDTENDLSPELPFGQWFKQIESALVLASPDAVLDVLYRELFDPSFSPSPRS